MNTQFASSSRVMPVNALAAFMTKLSALRLERQQAKAQRQEIARIARELESCTDRQLQDLGFYRSEIPAVARGSFGRE